MKQLFQESKLFSSGIILYILSFLFFCIFFGSVFILTEQFSDIQISRILENNTLFLLLLATCFFFGFLTFTTGTICLSQFLASYGFAKPVIFKQKILWWFRFIGILCIFPLYSLIKLLLSIKGKPLQNKLLSIVSSLFIFVIFLPVWTIYSFFLIASTTYIAGSSIGVAPVIENISGTGSMHPTFPKGTGKTDKENSEQTVATVIFWQYPGGVELFGKRYFGHILERGDIVAFENETTAKITTKQYGEASGLVKRVIGVAGDSLELRDGLVLINNDPIEEPYTASPRSTFAEEFLQECKKITVPVGSVFVMGDNRKGSGDSREFGFVPEEDIDSVLPLAMQEGEWDKTWRDTSRDFDEGSKIKINKKQYVALLNEKRKAAGVPILIYEEKLSESAKKRGDIILRFNDFSFEATKSGYTMVRAMNDVGYFNPLYGESPSQGYFTAEELLENQFAFPESKEFLLEKDYDALGIAEVEGVINGCPTQVLVQHFAGYVPPNYSQSDVASWREALANLREIQPGWADIKNSEEFYNKHKADIDRINDLITRRIANVSTVLEKMEANLWLNNAEQQLVNQDEALANEINALADKLNKAN